MRRMFIMSHKITSIKKQKGFAIVSAIFLIVVLAFLGVSMSRVFTSGQQAINQDITSLQAYYAAQSGLQWAMYQAAKNTPTGEHTISFSDSGLNNTKASVKLTKTTILSKEYYKITSLGCYGYTNNCLTDILTIPERSKRELELRFVP